MVLDADGNRNNQELDSGVGPLRPVLEQLGDGNETDKGNSTDRNLEKEGETGPLISINVQEGIMEPKMGTKDVVSKRVLSTSEMSQELDGGTTPLLTDVNQDGGSGTSPLLVHEMIQEHEGGTSPLLRGDGDSMTLYDTATNVVSIREDRGDCVMR